MLGFQIVALVGDDDVQQSSTIFQEQKPWVNTVKMYVFSIVKHEE